MQSVAENGVLMVTATDMAVLCGNCAEACFSKYGSYALHKEFCHEQVRAEMQLRRSLFFHVWQLRAAQGALP